MLFTLENAGYDLAEYDERLNGKFNYHRNENKNCATIELNSLEEFNNFVKTVNCAVIVYQNNFIKIYDDYIE